MLLWMNIELNKKNANNRIYPREVFLKALSEVHFPIYVYKKAEVHDIDEVPPIGFVGKVNVITVTKKNKLLCLS